MNGKRVVSCLALQYEIDETQTRNHTRNLLKPVIDPQTSQRTKTIFPLKTGNKMGVTEEVEKSQIQSLIYFNSSRNRKFLFIKTNISQETKRIKKRK